MGEAGREQGVEVVPGGELDEGFEVVFQELDGFGFKVLGRGAVLVGAVSMGEASVEVADVSADVEVVLQGELDIVFGSS